CEGKPPVVEAVPNRIAVRVRVLLENRQGRGVCTTSPRTGAVVYTDSKAIIDCVRILQSQRSQGHYSIGRNAVVGVASRWCGHAGCIRCVARILQDSIT